MDQRRVGFFLVTLALVASLALSAPQPRGSLTSPSGMAAQAAVNLNLNYSDPASDVAKMWTSNNTHVTDASGNWILSPQPADVNLLRLASTDASASIALYLKVQGSIASQSNISYEIRLYSRADNRTHYLLTFSNGTTWLTQNRTGASVANLTGSTVISPASTLNVAVAKTLLGGPANITAWNIDAVAKWVQPIYTYEDFVWQQPGNPASAPAFIQGRVTDASSGAGIANATVTTGAGGFSTVTNATGFYYLPADQGTFDLTFAASGYLNLTKTVTVNLYQTQTVNAALEKTVPPPSGPSLWLVVLVVIILAFVVVAVLVLRSRRRKAVPPPP